MKSRRAAIFEIASAELAAFRTSRPTRKEAMEAHAATMRVRRFLDGCSGKRLPKAFEDRIAQVQRIGEKGRLQLLAAGGALR